MKSKQMLVFALTALGLLACSSEQSKKLDYQSANNRIVSLEIPPDLRDPRSGDLYSLPTGTTASPNALNQGDASVSRRQVLSKFANVHLERSGTQRWLVVDNKQAGDIWSLLRSFWQDSGFTIRSEEPAIGVMETDWAENRAKLPSQGLRKLLDGVGLGSIYTTSERDKFLIRVEHNQQGGVDVFFSHKGMEEVLANKRSEDLIWQARPNDPNLEATFLARFMQYLGADENTVKQELTQKNDSQKANEFAKLQADGVFVYGKAERNVNRIGLALDRVGLTVQQFVPERGMFVVRPAVDEYKIKKPEEKGWLSSLFGKKEETPSSAPQESVAELFVALSEEADGQQIHILNQLGKPYTGKDLNKWLNGLYRELR